MPRFLRSSPARVLAALALAAVLLSGCSKRGTRSGGAPGFDPVAAVPADAIAVARLDVPTLLARPGLKDDQALVQKIVDAVRSKIGIDPALLRDATLFYAPIASESFPRRGAALIPQVLKDSPGLGKLGRARDYLGRAIYRLGQTATVAFTEHATIVGDLLSVQGSIEALAGKRAVLGKGHAVWRVLDSLGTQPFRLALKLSGFAPLLVRLGIPGLDKAEAAGLGLDIGDTDLLGELSLVTGDPPAFAKVLKGVLADLGAKIAASPLFKMFADLIAGVQVTTSGDRVVVSLKVPMVLVRTIAPLLLGTFGIN